MTKNEKILEIIKSKPKQKIGLDDFYGRQTVLNMLNEAINYTQCCKSDSEQFSFADMRDAFDYASVSAHRRDGMTFKEWISKR